MFYYIRVIFYPFPSRKLYYIFAFFNGYLFSRSVARSMFWQKAKVNAYILKTILEYSNVNLYYIIYIRFFQNYVLP